MSERELEVRCAAHAVELRAAENGLGTLAGYAAVFNRHSQNLGGFVEQVDPAAFNKSLADSAPVMARGNHDDAHLLGTTWAGTLRLLVDGTGLMYEVDLPDTTSGRDFHALAARGDVRWSSFAFRTIEDEWGLTEQGFPLRTLRSVQLVDVAPVNSPAYLDTTVAARNFAQRVADEAARAAAAFTDSETGGQRDTHPHAAVRARRLDLLALQ